MTVFLKRIGEGGVSRVACIVAQGLSDAGMKAEIVTFDAGAVGTQLLSCETQLTILGSGRADNTKRKRFGAFGAVLAMAAHLRRARPRVLMSPGNQTNVFAAMAHMFARSGNTIRLVVKITNPISKQRQRPWKRWYRKRLYSWIFSRASAIMVLSPSRKDELAAKFPHAAAKLFFVHNPYVTAAMTPDTESDRRSPISDERPMILVVGRLVKQKNLVMLLQAIALLKELPWHLIILGNGPEEAPLRELASQLGILERIDFLGYLTDPTPYYRRAHLLALSSKWEDLPAVVLEAMACGCPVVATACSDSLVSFLNQANYGRVVPVDDVAAFAQAIADLLAAPLERRTPPETSAYSIANGVADHVAVLGQLSPLD